MPMVGNNRILGVEVNIGKHSDGPVHQSKRPIGGKDRPASAWKEFRSSAVQVTEQPMSSAKQDKSLRFSSFEGARTLQARRGLCESYPTAVFPSGIRIVSCIVSSISCVLCLAAF